MCEMSEGCLMTERKLGSGRQALPRSPRSRRRWAVAAGVGGAWILLVALTGSVTGATITLALLTGAGVIGVAGLRALGVSRDHPLVRQLAARPWRDGQDVLQLALRHLPEVFVITPSGSLLAPSVVEMELNPDDLHSLCERMEIGLISMSAAEVYEEQVAARHARFAGPGPVDVRVIASSSVAPGRFRLRQGQPLNAGEPATWRDPAPVPAAPQLAHAGPQGGSRGLLDPAPDGPAQAAYPAFTAHDGNTHAEPEIVTTDMPTAMERSRPKVPTLRLVTGDSVAETTTSGAKAGRGSVELVLPQVPTVSREHARFVFSSGQWWIVNLGRNGLTLNGAPVAGESPLSTGDAIRWGTRPDALLSWVEVS